MKRKEIKNLAERIAKAEIALGKAEDSSEKHQLQNEITCLCGRITDFEEMIVLDDLVQEYISQLKD